MGSQTELKDMSIDALLSALQRFPQSADLRFSFRGVEDEGARRHPNFALSCRENYVADYQIKYRFNEESGLFEPDPLVARDVSAGSSMDSIAFLTLILRRPRTLNFFCDTPEQFRTVAYPLRGSLISEDYLLRSGALYFDERPGGVQFLHFKNGRVSHAQNIPSEIFNPLL